jgi:hypothetical protein
MILGGIMDRILFYAGLVVVALYVLSLLLHPYAQCEACKRRGAQREHGMFFTYAYRPCWRCKGRGTKQRFGAALLGIGEARSPRPNGKLAQSSDKFAKPARTRFLGLF